MKQGKIAVMPGSYDPVTNGHYDIALRAAGMFDRLYVVGFCNSNKQGLFSAEERLALLRAAFAEVPNIRVDISDQMLADYATSLGAQVLVKGLRSALDYHYECELAEIHRRLCPQIETVFLPARAEHSYLSSTYVRELIRYGRPLAGAVPDSTIPLLEAKREELAR